MEILRVMVTYNRRIFFSPLVCLYVHMVVGHVTMGVGKIHWFGSGLGQVVHVTRGCRIVWS